MIGKHGIFIKVTIMSYLNEIAFIGLSKEEYVFKAYTIDTNFKDIPAVYVITKRYPNGSGFSHDPYYIGITNDLPARLNGHHKLQACINAGANCICVHQDNLNSSREMKEKDLIKKYAPKMNDSLKP